MSTIIGLVSTFRLPLQSHGESPKGARKSGGLVVDAAGRQAEVQKEREKEADWILKRWKPLRKSKRGEKERWIGR